MKKRIAAHLQCVEYKTVIRDQIFPLFAAQCIIIVCFLFIVNERVMIRGVLFMAAQHDMKLVSTAEKQMNY